MYAAGTNFPAESHNLDNAGTLNLFENFSVRVPQSTRGACSLDHVCSYIVNAWWHLQTVILQSDVMTWNRLSKHVMKSTTWGLYMQYKIDIFIHFKNKLQQAAVCAPKWTFPDSPSNIVRLEYDVTRLKRDIFNSGPFARLLVIQIFSTTVYASAVSFVFMPRLISGLSPRFRRLGGRPR